MSNREILQSLMIQHQDGTIFIGEITEQLHSDQSCTIHFTSSVTGHLKFSDWDFFECLVHLRRKLAQDNYRPLCQGARLSVYPSRMCRDMGNGSVAYEMVMGKHAENLVSIFDYAEPELIASIDEQKSFFKRWVESEKEPIQD
jgi:hypothetical protein